MIANNSSKLYCLIFAIMGWFAIILQAYFSISNSVIPIFPTLTKFFSYFTILTNLIVVICFTFLYFSDASKLGKWFANAKILTAINVYIFIVGLVYNVALRGIYIPVGYESIADELLHVVMPLAFLIFWVFFVDKSNLKLKNAFSWLIYPLLYLSYTLIRGYFIKQYPYFFIDANELGAVDILINCLILFACFLGFSWLFIGLSKFSNKTKLKV